jgi:hypothetical protein
VSQYEALTLDGLPLNAEGVLAFPDPGFEVSMGGFVTNAPGITSGATASSAPTQPRTGTKSLDISTTAGQGVGYPLPVLYAGVSYTLRAWIRGNVGGEALAMLISTAAGAVPAVSAGSATTSFTGTTTYTQRSLTFTPSATTGGAYWDIYSTGTSRFFVDDIDATVSGPFGLESLSMPPPPKRPELISGADSNGAILARDPLHENRVIEARIRVDQQASQDTALGKVAQLVDALEECERHVNGRPLVWQPADATLNPITFRCLSGEITDLPITVEGDDAGWFQRFPVVTVRLTCLPFGEGTEVSAGTVTSTDPLIALELSSVAGDMPALGRLVVTDNATQSRRYVAWGLESRWLPRVSLPSLIVDSTTMVTSGFAGSSASRTPAYNGDSVIRATLQTQPQAIVGLPTTLAHVGAFRPQLRFWCSATTIAVRLAFQALDGPLRSLSYRVPVVAGWNHVDMGLIVIPEATLGAQRWTGRIEAYSTATGGESIDIDYLGLEPADVVYGHARAASSNIAGVIVARDSFDGTTSGAALGGRTADGGGVWSTSGSATDFLFSDAPERVSRNTTTDTGDGRFALLGTANYTGVEVVATVNRFVAAANDSGAEVEQHVLARYVDASNWVSAGLYAVALSAWDYSLRIKSVVAGVVSTVADVSVAAPPTDAKLRLKVFTSGLVTVDLLSSADAVLATATAKRTELATGGALATGVVGLRDVAGVSVTAPATTRYYDSVFVSQLPAESIALYSGRSIHFRHDGVLREDAAGTYAGPPPEYVGGRFFVPPAGSAGRKARIGVIARRNDVTTTADDNIADSTIVQAFVTPRYLAVPR